MEMNNKKKELYTMTNRIMYSNDATLVLYVKINLLSIISTDLRKKLHNPIN
jgi:hypothetical protein